MNKKLAIVGAHPDTREKVNWNDESQDIWLFNEWANQEWCKRWDAVLQLHWPSVYRSRDNEHDPGHWDWLRKDHGLDKRIYMQRLDNDVPNSYPYPLPVIENTGLTFEGQEVYNAKATASFAIALAVHQGYEEIHVFGIEMEHSSEYHSQQPNFAYWVGYANGRGVKVDLHCSRRLFDGPLYGYEGLPSENKLLEFKKGMTAQKAELEKQNYMLDGAIMAMDQLINKDLGHD